MNALGLAHALAASALPLVGLVGAWRAGTRDGRRAALTAGFAATVALVTGVLRQRGWEQSYRRAVYLASRAGGEWLDRKTHLGFAACAFAMAAALVALDRAAPRWLVRLLCTLAAGFALAALALIASVHASVPGAP